MEPYLSFETRDAGSGMARTYDQALHLYHPCQIACPAMHSKAWIRLFSLPAYLRAVCADKLDDIITSPDDALYDSGFSDTQEVLGALPCPDYTRYATVRQ